MSIKLRIVNVSYSFQQTATIIWQGWLEVKANVLIGSYSVGILPYEHFHGNGRKPCVSGEFVRSPIL